MKLVPKLTHPCDQDWSAMTGDDKCRFCSQCQLHVHNLSAMTPDEQGVVMELPGRKCVAMVQNAKAIEVRSGTWLLIHRMTRPLRAVAALVAIVLPLGISSCASPRASSQSSPPAESCATTNFQPLKIDGKVIAGGIMPPPTWWQRLKGVFRK
jgi:hypothetical protein